MASQRNIRVLVQPYGGYAPGTEFNVIRRHEFAPLFTVSPLDQPTRALTVPAEFMKEND